MIVPGLDMTTAVLGEIGPVVTRRLPLAELVTGGKPPRLCPHCAAPLRASRVNVSRCTNIGGPWKIVLICNARQCRHTELSTLSLEEWNNVHNHP